MNWSNLKKNKCPQCNKDCVRYPFNYVPVTNMLEHPCGFKITQERFIAIVSGMVSEKLEKSHCTDDEYAHDD